MDRLTDSAGNPIGGAGQTDKHGLHGTGGTGAPYGATGGMQTEHQGQGQGHGQLRRSGSSSSSSSEDDGQGGRRKKGLKEKIKDKMPGGGAKTTEQSHMPGTTTGQGQVGGEGYEKKGMMDKIKEKLPGQH